VRIVIDIFFEKCIILNVLIDQEDSRMAHKTVRNICADYGPRKGLEGPFGFNGMVLYYDTKEGMYYDPRRDMYLSKEEFDLIQSFSEAIFMDCK